MRSRKKKWAIPYINDHQELIYNKETIIDKELTLEVGIGKGDYIINHALDDTSRIHIGCEVDSSIFAISMKKIVEKQIDNIKLLNCKAEELSNYINEHSISSLILNFSDPWPQNGKRKRRLVHQLFLLSFEKLLKDGATISFKTDNVKLFEMAVRNFKERNYNITFLSYDYHTISHDFVSEYESKFRALNMPIHRIVATVNFSSLKEFDKANY